MPLTQRTIFVTGATGFVGHHLVRHLQERGNRVRCLVRNPARFKDMTHLSGVEAIPGDLTDMESLHRGILGCDYVFHIAGVTQSIFPSGWNANRIGGQHVAETCWRAGQEQGHIPVLVAVSSLAAAGPAPKRAKDEPIDDPRTSYRPKIETDIPNPFSPYGISKLAGEKELMIFSDRVPTTIVRPPIVFGPEDRLGFPLFNMAYRAFFFPVPGYYDQLFSFVFVKDLVRILVLLSEKGERLSPDSIDPVVTGNERKCSGKGIYFPASPERLLFSEFGRALALATGRRATLKSFRIPPAMVLSGGFFLEYFRRLTRWRVPLDWNKAREAIGGPWFCSGEKLQNQTGYVFEHSLAECFRETAQWYFDQHML